MLTTLTAGGAWLGSAGQLFATADAYASFRYQQSAVYLAAASTEMPALTLSQDVVMSAFTAKINLRGEQLVPYRANATGNRYLLRYTIGGVPPVVFGFTGLNPDASGYDPATSPALFFGLQTDAGFKIMLEPITVADYESQDVCLYARWDGAGLSVWRQVAGGPLTQLGATIAQTGTLTLPAGTQILTIGGSGSLPEFFRGILYDFQLWNTARSTAQMAQFAFMEPAPTSPGLLYKVRFDGAPGDTTCLANPDGQLIVADITFVPHPTVYRLL